MPLPAGLWRQEGLSWVIPPQGHYWAKKTWQDTLCINPVNRKYKKTWGSIGLQRRFLSIDMLVRTKHHGPWGVREYAHGSLGKIEFQGHFGVDKMSLWAFYTGPRIKDLLGWTEYLHGHFGQGPMAANRYFCDSKTNSSHGKTISH